MTHNRKDLESHISALQLECEQLRERHAELLSELSTAHDELVAALECARKTIHSWHGVIGWEEYQHSPEMTTIDNALARNKGDA